MATQAEIAVLKGTATQVKNESQVGGNSAQRVGGLFEGIVDALPSDEAIDGKISEAVSDIQPIVITGDVDNAPDQEDLTSVNQGGTDVLKFKDKTYAPALFSGLGRVYLRKNVVTPENLGYAVNLLTAEMVSQPNTIYHIQYDYDLNGQTITVPAGCVLEFDGGSLANGNINGNNTFIQASSVGIFNGVVLAASWKNEEFKLEWWKVTTETNVDNSPNVQCAVTSSARVRKLSVSGKYGISKPIHALTTHIYGKAITNFKDYGFVANNDFTSDTCEYGGVTYTASGMFYHSNNENPRFSNIAIDAAYHADYCVEHIANYSSVDFDNAEVYNARVAGVLQYGAERPVWNGLIASGCNIGAFISDYRFDATNFPSFKGEAVSSANLILLKGCRFIGNNIGVIINGGSNTALHDCETAHNSIFGAVCDGAKVLFTNFYSEGDATGNFYIYPDGNKEYNESGYSYVNTHLIDTGIDGVESLAPTYTIMSGVAHLRSIIYVFNQTMIKFNKSYYSFKPRSHRIDDTSADIVISPTNRDAAGIDAIIISKRSYVVDEDSVLYNHTANSHIIKPWVCVYNQISNGTTEGEIILRGQMNTYGIEGNNSLFDNYKANNNASYGCRLIDKPVEQLNKDINTRMYGTNNNNFCPMNRNKLMGVYGDIPLYKRDTSNVQRGALYYTKAQLLSMFGDRKYIKARVVVYLPNGGTTRLPIGYRYMTSSWGVAQGGFSADLAAVRALDAGFYDFVFPIRLDAAVEWERLAILVTIDNEASIEAYVSDVFFYDIVDSEMRTPYIEHTTIERGITRNRPYLPDKGQRYYDTTISKWIEWDGTQWVDATGTAV